ncbi:MAG TPA: tetratricopeptide repeat protein, partial [Candidatus Rifleibacterium sp.]|nr:tetratricopeptide repeat protein [Candidatus Rifleibacterium sp.]
MKFTHSLLFILICLCLTFSHAANAAPARQAGFDQYNPPDLLKEFEILRRRIRDNPRDVAAINSIGIIYARAGKLEDAIRLWRHGLTVDPRYIHLYNNLGSALKQKGRRDEARLVFKTGLNFSASFWISYNLGLLEKEEGNPAAAAACFKTCLAGNPGFQPAISQLAELGYHVQMPSTERVGRPL